MKIPDTETADRKELVEYIEWASKVLTGPSRLQIQLALLCDVLADDIESVSTGQTGKLKILTGEAKLFEQVMIVVKAKSDLNALNLITTLDDTSAPKKKITKMQDITLSRVK